MSMERCVFVFMSSSRKERKLCRGLAGDDASEVAQ